MVINNMLMQNGSVSIRHDMRSKKNEKAVSMSELRAFVDEGYYALSPAPVRLHWDSFCYLFRSSGNNFGGVLLPFPFRPRIFLKYCAIFAQYFLTIG